MTAAVWPRELWFASPGVVELRRGRRCTPTQDHVLARALASGISQGTEMLLFRGEGSQSFDPSLGQTDEPTYPRRYGYSWVGEIIELGPACSQLSVGDRVFALASHGDLHELPTVSARRIDAQVPATRAVLAANLETAITCIWDSRVSLGDRVFVFGAGVVGLLIAWLCSKTGADVKVFEPSEVRQRAARRLSLLCEVKPREFESEADVVVEASGNPEALDQAIACAGQEARIVVVSNYGARRHAPNLGDRFHRRRLTLKSSQVSNIPPDRMARWSIQRRFELVQRLLEQPELDLLVDNVVDFSRAPEVYHELEQRPGDWLQTVFVYDERSLSIDPSLPRIQPCLR